MISYVQLKVLQICAKCHGLEKYAKVDFFGDEYFLWYVNEKPFTEMLRKAWLVVRLLNYRIISFSFSTLPYYQIVDRKSIVKDK